MHQLLDQAIAQMRADGMPEFPPGHPKVSVGKITRYGPKGRAWYRLEIVRTRAGTEVIVGAYGDWRSQLKAKIDVDWKGISAEERAELNARMRQQEEAEREKREERGRNAANRAKMQFRDSVSIEDARALGIVSAYLVRKGVEPEGCRFWRDGTVLVPVYALDTTDGARMVGLQRIASDGTKKFNAGMVMEGSVSRLGSPPDDGEPILLCEGYATALSIRLGTLRKHPVYVAFHAGNLPLVARLLRARYPNSPIVICADDDWKTEVPKGTPFNPGVVKADQAARAVGRAGVVVPLFITASRQDGWTDFNDLHQAHGIAAVSDQLDLARIAARIEEEHRARVQLDAPSSRSDPEKPVGPPSGEDGGEEPPPWLDEAPPPSGPPPLSPPSGEPAGFRGDWIPPGRALHLKKSGDALGDLHNVVLHLQFHPDWLRVLAFDQFSEAITKLRPPPYVDGCVGEWRDLDDAETLHWLSDYMAEPTAATVRTAVLIVANRSKFNKVRDYLEACALAWDGVSRLETWLIDFMGVCRGARFDAMPENDRARTLAYVRLAGSKWLIAGAARALSPGCRVDTMLILEGEQGLMKSTALRTLGGEWFSDARLDFSNKDTLLLLQGRWIIEMPELEGMNKADTSETKRFLTQHEDIFRKPYGATLTKSPRRCIFAGTVNHETYLKDDSGNRRFWPVRVSSVDLDGLAAARDQLWGEAVHRFREGVAYWVKPDERALFEEQQDLRFQVDAWEGLLRAFLDGDGELQGRLERVKMEQLLGSALKLDKGKWDRQCSIRVGSIMRRIGWERKRENTGARDWYYQRPEASAADGVARALEEEAF
jgi:putative DNA primase/helicase